MGTSESHLSGRKAPFPCNLRMSSSSFCNLYPTPWQKKILWNAITSLSLLAIAAVVVFTLYVATQILAFLQPLLLPVAVSGVFAYLLEPVVSWLPEKRCLDSWLSLSCLERLSWVQRFWLLESFPPS